MSPAAVPGRRQRPLVLYVCHNHPSVRPGGAEAYAHELFLAARERDEVDVVFLAKGGPPLGRSGRLHEGSVIAPVGDSADEYFFFTDGYQFDWLNGTLTDKDFYTRHMRRFLEALRPDVVHFQHTLFLGYDILREVRNTLPDAAIVYTLHEYAPICHRDGQLLRTVDESPCTTPSARRCHECFPDISAQDFFLRKRYIQSHLELVDMFISPSRFLVDRYIDWGIPPERIIHEENGRVAPRRVAKPRLGPDRNRFGYFGQLSRFKGVDVLLEAMRLVDAVDRGDPMADLIASLTGTDQANPGSRSALPVLSIHGANLDLQHGPWQDKVRALLESTTDRVTMVGKYRLDDLPQLMEDIDWVIVPSIWFENAPLVIQEAFAHGRPVICSDIGGMAEKVTHGVDGLHFRAGNARSLAEVLTRAASEPGLWESLHNGISPVHDMDTHVDNLTSLYRQLLAERSNQESLHG